METKKYDPNDSMYMLDLKCLKKGDVICTAADTFKSKVIRKATNGSFSHSILMCKDLSYIHAISSGVLVDNPQRLLFSSEDDVVVLRLRDYEKNIINIDKACYEVQLDVGRIYSVWGAVSNILPKKISSKKTVKKYCSQLVAEAYAKVGIWLVEDPQRCAPNDLVNSPLFEKIPNLIVKADAAQIAFAMSENPLIQQHNTITYMIRNIQNKTKNNKIQTMQEAFEYLLFNHKWDDVFTKILIDSKYLCLFSHEEKMNAYRYNSYTYYKYFMQKNDRDIIKDLIVELKAAEGLVRNFEQHVALHKFYWDRTGLQFFKVQYEVFSKNLEKSYNFLKNVQTIKRSMPLSF